MARLRHLPQRQHLVAELRQRQVRKAQEGGQGPLSSEPHAPAFNRLPVFYILCPCRSKLGLTHGAAVGVDAVAAVLDGDELAVGIVLAKEDGGAFDHAAFDGVGAAAVCLELAHGLVKVHVRDADEQRVLLLRARQGRGGRSIVQAARCTSWGVCGRCGCGGRVALVHLEGDAGKVVERRDLLHDHIELGSEHEVEQRVDVTLLGEVETANALALLGTLEILDDVLEQRHGCEESDLLLLLGRDAVLPRTDELEERQRLAVQLVQMRQPLVQVRLGHRRIRKDGLDELAVVQTVVAQHIVQLRGSRWIVRILFKVVEQLLPALAEELGRLVRAPPRLHPLDPLAQRLVVLSHDLAQLAQQCSEIQRQARRRRQVLGPIVGHRASLGRIGPERSLEFLLDHVHDVLGGIAVVEQILADDHLLFAARLVEEGGGKDLGAGGDATLGRGVDGAVGERVGVHDDHVLAHVVAKLLGLVARRMRELAAPLDDELHLGQLGRLLVEARLDLDLGAGHVLFAVDELDDQFEILDVGAGEGERLGGGGGDEVELGAQDDLLPASLKEGDEGRSPGVGGLEGALELLLGRAVAVAEDGDGGLEVPGGALALARACAADAAARAADGPSDDLVVAEAAEDVCALVVVEVVALDKAPAVDVDDVALAADAEEVEAADVLLEGGGDGGGHFDLFGGEFGDVADLLAVWVAFDDAVDDGRLAGLCMDKVRADGVDLDVLCIVDVHELLVDVRAVGARVDEVGVVLGRLVADLAEEATTSAALGLGEVDVDVVVLARDGLLDKGLCDLVVADDELVVRLEAALFGVAVLAKVCADSGFEIVDDGVFEVRAAVAVDLETARGGHAYAVEDLEDGTTVPEDLLEAEVVDEDGLAEVCVGDGLVERKSGGEEGDEHVYDGPVLDGFVEDDLFAKDGHVELLGADEAVEDVLHGLGARLAVHGGDAQLYALHVGRGDALDVMMGGRMATFFCSSVRPDMKRPCERLKIYLK
ncbi:hypothetical protein L1887_54401 [Cichorium endivia]|nr:hypothetical protein L1887_54401 [Cichorium endivia]